jgi:hypothetical protein
MSAGNARCSLTPAQGVDTSDCFERSDLEAKYRLLSEPSRRAAASSAAAAAAAAADDSGSSGAAQEPPRSSEATAPPLDPFAWPREQAERLSAFAVEQAQALTRGDLIEAARARIAELNVSLGVSAKAREFDKKLGLGDALRSNGPRVWKAFNEARETPAGQMAQFVFTTWLFLSGAFWTLLSWTFLGFFVVNLVAPNLIRDALDDAVANAAAAARAANPQAGGGPAAGMPGSPPGGGFRPGGSQERRRDLSGGGGVVDVDARDVKK